MERFFFAKLVAEKVLFEDTWRLIIESLNSSWGKEIFFLHITLVIRDLFKQCILRKL